MNQHLSIRMLAQKHKDRNLNEADSRAHVIDTVVHEVLDWPKSSVKREVSVNPGFADYLLYNAAGQTALVIEAKREGSFFRIPQALNSKRFEPTFVSVRALLTDSNISEAMMQVRNYCLNIGCNFGCITNGHEWIFFRVFESGEDWRTLRAYVIPSLDAFDSCFTSIFNSLSYRCVSYDGSLNALISRTSLEDRETFRPGNEIPAYNRTIQANKYIQYLRPIAERFFGAINADQTELMNECYVSDPTYEQAFRSAEAILGDSLTPYLENYGIKDTSVHNDSEFTSRIEATVTRQRPDVVVLFGGKGIGKSTFLRRLLYTRPPKALKDNAVTILIDLLNTPEDKVAIEKQIWQELVEQADIDSILKSDRSSLLNLFSDRYELALKQELFGIPPDTVEFNKALNDLVSRWKDDLPYVAKRLREYLRSKSKGLIVVIDNTDQYKTQQEYCFMHAQKIANKLGCLVIISMREERFYTSSIHGLLDAYQNSGFHLSSPPPGLVFLKRLEFVLKLLLVTDRRNEFLPSDTPQEVIDTVRRLLLSFYKEFNDKESHLASFLAACAHGNIRLALELFRGMLQSRYTNVDEITSKKVWTWQIHQVLKPVMIPKKFFYDESQSHIPNILQLRSKKRSSHFTTLRILSSLIKHSDLQGTAFYSLPHLLTESSNRFHMEEDQKAAFDVLLRYGLIESDNRLDEYAESIDLVRATPYGRYIYHELSSAFTYLDLISTDTALFDSRVSAELARLAEEEYVIWETAFADPARRMERVEKRLTKTREFVHYLNREEEREATFFGLTEAERFMPRIIQKLDAEMQRVRRSAGRQNYR